MIPKTIYYAWFGPKKISTNVKRNIGLWKKLNPNFNIVQINEKNFNINNYKFTKQAYDDGDWAFVSDVARLDIIYKNGGFYLDTDVKLVKSIDTLTKFDSVWALENSDAINPGSAFGAKKGDENIKDLLEIYKEKTYIHGNDDMIIVHIVSNYFMKHGFRIANKKQLLNNGKTVILPSDYFTPLHYWGGGHVTKNTIGIHQFQGSWQDNNYSLNFRLKRQLMLLFPKIYCAIRHLRENK